MSKEDTVSATQKINWAGSIPVVLTLAPTSVSSPTLPPKVHVLVPRNTYMHLGLRDAVKRLHPFAPLSFAGPTLLQIREPDPGGDDDESDNDDDGDASNKKDKATRDNTHDLINTTFDSQQLNSTSTKRTFIYPVCWLEDEETNIAVRWHLFAGILFDLKSNRDLPWKLKLHFNNYPSSQILPLEEGNVLAAIQASFKHGLKQSMTVANGNSKAAMNVTKESHGWLWEAVTTNNYQLYQRVDISPQSPTNSVPVRVLVNSQPPIQRRLSVTREEAWTLGDVLQEWLPNHFREENGTIVASTETVHCWRICGIQPPLSTPILDLWRRCSYPDHFLYIVVQTSKTDTFK